MCVCVCVCLTKAVLCITGGKHRIRLAQRGEEAAGQQRPPNVLRRMHPHSYAPPPPLISHAVIHTLLSPLPLHGIIPLATGCSSASSPSVLYKNY
jgi:hypothetical protein